MDQLISRNPIRGLRILVNQELDASKGMFGDIFTAANRGRSLMIVSDLLEAGTMLAYEAGFEAQELIGASRRFARGDPFENLAETLAGDECQALEATFDEQRTPEPLTEEICESLHQEIDQLVHVLAEAPESKVWSGLAAAQSIESHLIPVLAFGRERAHCFLTHQYVSHWAGQFLSYSLAWEIDDARDLAMPCFAAAAAIAGFWCPPIAVVGAGVATVQLGARARYAILRGQVAPDANG